MSGYSLSSCTEAQKDYVRLALYQVRNWRGQHDYEDMASEAVLGAFAAVSESTGDARWLNRVAARGAKSAALNYLRYYRRLKRAGGTLSFTMLRWDAVNEQSCELMREPEQPDFVPDLIGRVDWLMAIRQRCSPEQQRYLYRFYYLGQTYNEIAQAESVTRKRVDNTLYKALQQLRAALAAGDSDDGSRDS